MGTLSREQIEEMKKQIAEAEKELAKEGRGKFTRGLNKLMEVHKVSNEELLKIVSDRVYKVAPSTLKVLQELAPKGLVNKTETDKNKQKWHQPSGKGKNGKDKKWTRCPQWLKEEIHNKKAGKLQITKQQLKEIADRFRP